MNRRLTPFVLLPVLALGACSGAASTTSAPATVTSTVTATPSPTASRSAAPTSSATPTATASAKPVGGGGAAAAAVCLENLCVTPAAGLSHAPVSTDAQGMQVQFTNAQSQKVLWLGLTHQGGAVGGPLQGTAEVVRVAETQFTHVTGAAQGAPNQTTKAWAVQYVSPSPNGGFSPVTTLTTEQPLTKVGAKVDAGTLPLPGVIMVGPTPGMVLNRIGEAEPWVSMSAEEAKQLLAGPVHTAAFDTLSSARNG